MNEGLTYFLQQVINGLSCGAIYSMIAIGYSMVYGVLGLINFAHGDLYVFGTFIAYSLIIVLSGMVNPWLLAIVAGCLAGCVGMVIERLAYRPIRKANRMVPMISAFGCAAVLKTISQAVWGPEAISFESLSFLPEGPFMLGNLQVYNRALFIPAVSLAVVIIMQYILNHTKFGLGTRCIMQDSATSNLIGVPSDTIIPLIYFLGGFLGVMGGVLYCSYYGYGKLHHIG